MENENLTEAAAAVTAVINNLPVGMVMPYMGVHSNLAGLRAQGWLPCDGASYKVDDRRDLYEAIGNAYGGNSNEFFVPDLRGMFIRGCDEGTGRDPDAGSRTAQNPGGHTANGVGTRQEDQLRAHNHTTKVYEPVDWFNTTHSGTDWKPPCVPNDVASTNEGGNETRPKNVYAYYVIFAGLK